MKEKKLKQILNKMFASKLNHMQMKPIKTLKIRMEKNHHYELNY